MAMTLTIPLSDAHEATLVLLTGRFNMAFPGENLTPQQFAARWVRREWLEARQRELDEDGGRTRLEKYRALTPEDKAAIDAILNGGGS